MRNFPHHPRLGGRLDLEGLARQFLGHCRAKGHTPKTLAAYDYYLGRFAKFAAGRDDDFKSILLAYAREARTFGNSKATGETALRPVITFANWLRAEGLWCGQHGLKHRSTLGLPKAADLDAVRRLLGALDAETALLVKFLLATDLRLGEALGVRAADFDRRAMTVTVRGKGGRERAVGMGRRVARLLRPIISRLRPDLPLFPAPARTYQTRIYRAARAAGLRVSPHRLRHTFAKEMLQRRRVGLHELQALMGHTTPAMTLHYARLYASEAVEAHRRFAPTDIL